jgi:hypothetical protein
MQASRRLFGFIAVVQCALFLTHLFLYETWTFSPADGATHDALWIELLLGLLSVSFVAASLLAFRYTNAVVRAFYRGAAVWLGLLTFFFLAAVSSWIIFGVAQLAGLVVNFHQTVEVLFAVAAAVGLYGVFNAGWTRITRTTVRLANLPEAWRGRKAALISDLHLGHVRNGSFLRRMVAKILREEPDAIFIAGDLYDGTAIDAGRAAEPLNELKAPTVFILSRETTSSSATTANICVPLRPPACACSAMRKWKSTACRSSACPTTTRPSTGTSPQCCTPCAWIATAQAFF